MNVVVCEEKIAAMRGEKHRCAPQMDRAGARRATYHDQVNVGVGLRDEHDFAGRSCKHELLTRLRVAQEVRAYALFGRVLGLHLRAPIRSAAHTERSGCARHVVTVSAGRDRVEAHRVWFPILWVDTRWDNTVRLTLPVRHLALVVHYDIARFASCLGADDTLGANHLGNEWRLHFVRIDRDIRLVPVRRSFQKVLFLRAHGDRA